MTRPRSLPTVVLTMPTPVVVAGKPVMPAVRGRATVTSTIGHISSGKVPATPPPGGSGGSGSARRVGLWSVDDLPDPSGFANGWYWLGEPSGSDGTAAITADARQWAASGSSQIQAAWHSQFPFKPSVSPRNSYLRGGGVVHHPKGVNFNSFYIEHMWADLGGPGGTIPRPQPFTWVVACLAASWPNPVQYLLDSGKPPPRRYGVAELGSAHKLGEDDLGYRTALQLRQFRVDLAASSNSNYVLRLNHAVPATPRMYVGVFNGASSRVAVFGPGGKSTRTGTVQDIGESHRLMVLGRRRGWLSRPLSSHLLVFELRYWARALSAADLDDEYADLASRWQFGAYARGG